MTVLVPLEGFNRSGGIRVLTAVVNGLARAGAQVTILTPEYAASPPFPLDPAVVVEAIRTSRRGSAAKVECLTRMVVEVRRRHPKLVLATGFRTAWIAFAGAPRRQDAVRVYLIQHYETLSQGLLRDGSLPARLGNALFAEASYLLPFRRVAVSGWIRDQLPLGVDSKVVLNGVDSSVFHPPSTKPANSPLVVGCIGRTSRVKGWSTFLAAVDRLPRSERRLLVAAPAGLDAVSIERNDLRIVQPRNDREVGDFYRACDIFVYPSKLEGFGLPPLEAMACGVPVVSTDCGGTRDFLHPGNSLVVPPEDAGAMSKAIGRLLQSPPLRRQLRAGGLQTASELTIQASVQQHVNFLLATLAD